MKPARIVDEGLLETVRYLCCLACASLDPEGARVAIYENDVRCHPHHLVTRGSGGGDIPWNVAPFCGSHHRVIHSIGIAAMARKFVVFKDWLEIAGWAYDSENDFWNRPTVNSTGEK